MRKLSTLSSWKDGCHFSPLVIKVMTKQPSELLHIDTVGPARVCSIREKWCVLVIVDDFSCYSWVFFMKEKDEIFHMLEMHSESDSQECHDSESQ
jgi:hypothetical protein